MAVALALLSLLSCTLSKLNQVTTEYTEINLDMDWSAVSGEHPDEMYVFATKHITLVDYVCTYPSSEEFLWYSGNYNVACINKSDNLIVDNQWGLDRVSVALPVNEGYVEDSGELYSDYQSVTITPGLVNDVLMTPEQLSQKLTVRFRIYGDSDVEIKSLKAVLTGVSNRVYPMTGVVNYEGLCNVVLPVRLVDVQDGVHQYEAQINILGLFPPENAQRTSGKGILSLEVFSSSYLGERTLSVGYNLKSIIEETGPMKIKDDGSGYCIAKTECVFEVPTVLAIGTDASVGNEETDGVERWFHRENIDINL